MRAIGRWIIGIFLGLLVVSGAALAAVFLVVWNLARPYVEDVAGAALGRELRIGALAAEPGWRRWHVVLRDVTIANTAWGGAQPFAAADEISLIVDPWPLLRGRLDLPEVVLRRPEIAAERDAEGRENWVFGAAAEAVGDVAAPEERSEFPYIGALRIEDGTLSYRDAVRELELSGAISTATGDMRGNVELALKGTLEGRALRLDFVGASLVDLRERAEPYPFDLSLSAGGTDVAAQGTVTEPVQLRGFDVDLSVSGPSMADVFPIFGIPLPETAPFVVQGQLRRDGDVWRFDDFTGTVDDSDLGGWMSVDYTPERPVFRAQWVSRELDLHDLGGLIGLDPRPAEENAAGEASAQTDGAGGLLPDTPLNVERLKAMDMDIELKGERVVAEALPIDRLDMRFRVVDGRLRVEPLVFYVAEGRIEGAVTIDAGQDPPEGAADLAVRDLDLRPFFRDSAFVEEMNGRFVGSLDLAGRGLSLADMLGSADGAVVLAMQSGQVSGLLVEAAGLDLVEALALVIEGDTPIEVRCGLIDATVADGVARLRRGVIDTTDSMLVLGGAVDLGAETMDVGVEAHEKDFSLIDAAAPVRVSGPFRGPEIAIGGVDPLPFFEMGETKDVNCARLLEEMGDGGE